MPVAPAAADAGQRLLSLDLIRGIAVLGILAINIAGFAGPSIGTVSPALTAHDSLPDRAAFAFGLLFFEGKMRGLFTLLFGAGLVLFWERMEADGRDGDVLQLRRLAWLMAIGALHYVLLWWGDILFVYALCGLVALLLRPLSDRWLLVIALLLFTVWHLWGLLDIAPLVQAEHAVRAGTATLAERDMVSGWLAPVSAWATQEMSESRLGFLQLALIKLSQRPFWQLDMVSGVFSETVPMMLIGMVMYRRGFFDGRVARARLMRLGVAATGAGLTLTALFLAWAWPRGLPPIAMEAAISWGLAVPHLLCSVGYAALLVLATPRLAQSGLGARLIAAGRTAFSNYIGTSIVMTAVFYGWGLGLYGRFGSLAQWAFVLVGWTLMLGWSAPWLRRFRRGPLEWLWRNLIERKVLPNRI